jgi:hypothetical protein
VRALDNRPDLFQVMDKQCDACLFTKDRIVSGDRAAQIIRDCKSEGTHFVCHEASMAGGKNVCCRAFFDTQDTLVIQLAKALGRVVFVNVEKPE